MSADPVKWLNGVLDEHEAIARAATPGPWESATGRYPAVFTVPGGADVADLRGFDPNSPYLSNGEPLEKADARHIAAHDPAAVLADIAAKRGLLRSHTPGPHFSGHPLRCSECLSFDLPLGELVTNRAWPCQTVRLLVSAYRDWPGWQEAWAPDAAPRGAAT